VSTDECAERYPAEVTFVAATYRGARGDDQGMIWWDAGTYRLADEQTLVLSTATDELVEYPVEVTPERFTFTDPDGCEVVYERVASPPP
jgi:outer membrane lipoprotein-sorting protein